MVLFGHDGRRRSDAIFNVYHLRWSLMAAHIHIAPAGRLDNHGAAGDLRFQLAAIARFFIILIFARHEAASAHYNPEGAPHLFLLLELLLQRCHLN